MRQSLHKLRVWIIILLWCVEHVIHTFSNINGPPHSTGLFDPDLQVKNNYLPSPFNLMHLLLFWMPSFDRPLSDGRFSRMLMMINPDGDQPPDIFITLRDGRVSQRDCELDL